MPLLTEGFWQTTFWPDSFWAEDFWQDYGTAAPGISFKINTVDGIDVAKINTVISAEVA